MKVTDQKCHDSTMEIDVSYIIFLIATITFVGTYMFIIFGGAGLFGLPLSFI